MGIEEIATKRDLAEMERRIMEALADFHVKPEKDKSLDTEQATRHIGAKSKSTLYKLTSSGEIAYYKVGKCNVYKESDLDRFLATRRKASAAEISATVTRRSLGKRTSNV